MGSKLAKLQKFWLEISILAVMGWNHLGPTITAVVQANPKISADVLLVAAFLAKLAKSSLAADVVK